jgi:cobalt-precorrin-7 (C5)-methyltransferase
VVKLNIVGVGPGSEDYVTPVARKIVRHAHLVIGSQRSLNLFTEEIKSQSIVLTAKNLKEVLEQALNP